MHDHVSRIQGYLREQARAAHQSREGTLLTTFFDDPALPLTHFAIPNQPLGEAAGIAARQLRIESARRRVAARLQLIDTYAPELIRRLAAWGFGVEQAYPVMAVTADRLIEPPGVGGLRIEALDREAPDDVLWAYVDAYSRGFGLTAPPREVGVTLLRRELDHRAIFLASVGGAPAGTGQFRAIAGGVTEVGSISTVPEHRRRGVGSALAAHAARAAFQRGADLVFLLAESADSVRLYERIGFARCGSLVELVQGGSAGE